MAAMDPVPGEESTQDLMEWFSIYDEPDGVVPHPDMDNEMFLDNAVMHPETITPTIAELYKAPAPPQTIDVYNPGNISTTTMHGCAVMSNETATERPYKRACVEYMHSTKNDIYFYGYKEGTYWKSESVAFDPPTHIKGGVPYTGNSYHTTLFELGISLQTVSDVHEYIHHINRVRLDMYTRKPQQPFPFKIHPSFKTDANMWKKYEPEILGNICALYKTVPHQIVRETMETVFRQKQSTLMLSDGSTLMDNIHMTLMSQLDMSVQKKIYKILPRKATSSTLAYLHLVDIALRCGCMDVCTALESAFVYMCANNRKARLDMAMCECANVTLYSGMPQPIIARMRHACITDGIRYYMQCIRYRKWILDNKYADTMVSRWAFLNTIYIEKEHSENIYFVPLLKAYLAQIFRCDDVLIMCYLYNVLGYGNNKQDAGCAGITMTSELYTSAPSALTRVFDVKKSGCALSTPPIEKEKEVPATTVLIYKLYDLVENYKNGRTSAVTEIRYNELESHYTAVRDTSTTLSKEQSMYEKRHWSEIAYTEDNVIRNTRNKQMRYYHNQAYICARKYYRPHNSDVLQELLEPFEACMQYHILMYLHQLYCEFNNLPYTEKNTPFHTTGKEAGTSNALKPS